MENIGVNCVGNGSLKKHYVVSIQVNWYEINEIVDTGVKKINVFFN